MDCLLFPIRRLETWLLIRLLARFAMRQMIANGCNASKLVDCSTVIIDEVAGQ